MRDIGMAGLEPAPPASLRFLPEPVRSLLAPHPDRSWSRWSESNGRPHAPKARALPAAPHRVKWILEPGSPARLRTATLLVNNQALDLLSDRGIEWTRELDLNQRGHTPMGLQPIAFDRSAIPRYLGASCTTRTCNLRLRRPAL